ncbi:MAG: diguanylate cyclase (GGDEF)-like protein/PAS domain S-box-containing protein, partial [Gammaproteobacteria bacterium]
VRPNMPRQYCHVKIDPVRERDNVIGVVVIIRDITQMHHMSEQLRETQDRYQSVIENSADIMIISRLADGNIKTVNKAFTEITGHEIRDVIGSKAVSYYAEPDDRKVFVDTLKQSGRCSEFETQIKTKDGRTIPVLLASNLVDYDDEQCIFTVARDISERKSAENALNEKNRSINLLQKITVAVNEASSVEHGLQICLDELCGYCDWPLGHAYILNTDSGLLESSRVWHLESAGKFAAFRRLTEETDFDKNVGLPGRILTSGKPEWIEDVSRDGNFPRNKTEEQIEVSSAFGFPVLAGDKIVAVMEFFHDLRIPRDEMLMEAAVLIGVLVGRIIERKNAEMALQQYQVNFSKAVNASPDSVIVIRLYDGAILDVNDAVVEATGYSRDELIQSGNGMMFWVSDDECKKHARQLKKKGRIANYSMLTKLKNGNTIPCLMSSTLIKVDGANCAFSIIKDISELTIVHEAIQESQKQSLLIKNTAPLSISYVDNNLRYRFTNLEFEQGFRISNESTKGKTIREVVGANKYKQLEPYISAALSGSVVKFETIITNTKGVKLVYELTYHPDKRDGVVQGVYIISSNITERKKTELTLIKTNRALRVLNECSQVLVKEENESALLQAVCDIAIREGGYHMAWVAFGSSDNSKDIISVAYSPENKDTKSFERKERSLDKRLVRKVMDTGKPYAIRNVNDMGNNFKWRDEVLRRGHMCALGLPLKSRTKTLGVLIITSTEVEAFDEEEMKLLASMAENLTYGMLAIRETGKRKKAESLLALETHAFQLLASFSTLPLFLEDLVRNIESKVEGKQCSVLLFNEGDKCLYDGASPSLDENYIKAIVGLKTGENSGPCARAAYLNKHVIVKDAYTDPLWRDYRELAIKYQVRSCSATPITTSDGRVVGTLTIYSKETGEPDHHELQICNRMAYIIGGAIDRYQIEKTLKENEERFALAMKGSQDGLWDLNLETNEVYWSPGWKKMLGYEENELKHPSLSGFLQMLHPDDQGVHERIIEEALDNFEIEFRMKHKNGHYVDILSRSTGLCTTKGGQASRIVGTHVDLTERNRSALRIKESENRFRSLYNDSPAMFMTLDEKGVVLSINKFGADHLGASVSALIDSSIFDITHKEDREGFIQKLKVCDGQSNKVQRCEIRMLHKFGDIIWVRTTMRSIELGANTKSILVTCEDITEARILSEQLEYQAKHDALTGLINRAEFEKRLRRVLNADSDDGEHALCYLDLDQFKIINDTCGHLAGDELLRRVSDILNTVVRKRDTLARMGGDEFAVLLEHCSIDQAKRVANELIHSVETLRFVWEGKRFTLGVSIGLVPMRKGSGTLTDILSAADSACYAAKDAGRNRTHVYYSDDIELSLRRGEMEWVSKINDALEDGHFCLERQTISCLNKKSKQRHGNHYEILLRMQSGDGQLVYPGAFLPAAERYNLSEKIDRWVVSKTLGWLSNNVKELESLALCTINLSGLSMGNDDFLEFLLNLFDRSIVPADKICFEITETAAIGNLGAAIQFIHALKEIGCQFALDDFGTGVSSFNYLKNLPVDYLKIDGSFIREIHKDPIDFAMVRSINEIGHVMGKETIAEFVENDAILDVVRSIGINYAQGLAIDKPVPINLKEN